MFGKGPEFFGWWRFNRADTVTISPAGGATTAVLQRMEASGRVKLNVDSGNMLVVSNLFGMGTVRKVGGGDFEVVRTGGEYVNLDVRDGGTLTVHEQEKGDEVTFQSVLSNAYVHFDASDIGNFEFNAAGRISKWKGSAPKPTASATELTTNKYGSAVCIKGHDAPLPRYVANYSATGLGVVDFGPYRALTDADLDMISGGVIDPETQKALEKLTPEQRENCMKLGESLQKWAEKERHPGWQGH